MFSDFGDEFSTFFPEVINFISENAISSLLILFNKSFKLLNKQILQCIDKNQTEEKTKAFFSIPVNQLFDEQPFISDVVDKNKFNEFLKIANIGKVKNLAHLYMVKCISKIVKDDKNQCIFIKKYFTEQNYQLFLDIEKQIFDIPFADQNTNDQQSTRNMHDKSIYKRILSFFHQYFINEVDFFEFKSNIEIVTSTSLDKPSTSYCSIRANSITKIFPNSPPFAYFIRYALFGYGKHNFLWNNFCESIERYPSQDKLQSQDKYAYTQYEKQSGKRKKV